MLHMLDKQYSTDQYLEFSDISMSAFAVQYRGWNVSTGGAKVG
jgi:hypothetical protein